MISWIPLTIIDENIITAAPPSTDCGMIDINAPSLGIRPHNIRNTAPDASAILLTTLVIATRPTFWLNDVLGSTPKSAASDEPKPSHITPPESSLSVASLPTPPTITPDISPTVSTAVTTNITSTGSIALKSNTGLTGINLGIAIHLASATLFQLSTHDLVYSTPSAVTAVCGSTQPIIAATI